MYNLSGNIIIFTDNDNAKNFSLEFQKSFTADDGNISHTYQSNSIKFNNMPPNFPPENVVKYLKKVNASSAARPDVFLGIL